MQITDLSEPVDISTQLPPVNERAGWDFQFVMPLQAGTISSGGTGADGAAVFDNTVVPAHASKVYEGYYVLTANANYTTVTLADNITLNLNGFTCNANSAVAIPTTSGVGDKIDLTGYTFGSQIRNRPDGTVLKTFSITVASDYTVTLSLTDSETATIAPTAIVVPVSIDFKLYPPASAPSVYLWKGAIRGLPTTTQP